MEFFLFTWPLRRNNFNQTSDERLFNLYEKCDQFEFDPFGIADYNCSDFEMDVDPNNNFYNDVITRCKYYTETQLVGNSKSIEGLSCIHFNARSLNANFAKIRNLIDELKTPFDIIAITETWLESDNYLDFLLNDYEFCHKN